MKRTYFHILLIVIALIINGCANAVSPTGGPKDELPPVVLNTSPDNFSKNFSEKSLQFTFDEFVTIDNPGKNVLISPPLEKTPSYRLNGKTLNIKFNEVLLPQTTYSINFGVAIKDLHEGNILKDYSFVFSTGDVIDSLSLAGHAISAMTLKPSDDFFVMLYVDDNDTLSLDSLPYCTLPRYITKTDKNGNFFFTGLADREYLLFTLKDINSNMKFDISSEEIGFYQELVKPQYIPITKLPLDSTATIEKVDTVKYQLKTFVEEDSIQKLFKKELVKNDLLRFIFRYPADDVDIKIMEELPDSFNIMKVFSPRKDTVSYYFTANKKDSLWISINYDTIIRDTTHYSLTPRTSVKPNRKKTEEDTPKYLTVKNNTKNNKLKPDQPFLLVFSEPVMYMQMRDTTMYVDGKDTTYNNLSVVKDDEYGFRYRLCKDFEQGGNYGIMIPDSVFFGINGYVNDTIKMKFSVGEPSQYGNIYLTINIPDDIPQIIVELLNGEKVVSQKIIKTSQEVSFENLDPAAYKLKVIYDMDSNGVWSSGSFSRKIQPEKIIFYKTNLEVKANWDIDLEEPWNLQN